MYQSSKLGLESANTDEPKNWMLRHLDGQINAIRLIIYDQDNRTHWHNVKFDQLELEYQDNIMR